MPLPAEFLDSLGVRDDLYSKDCRWAVAIGAEEASTGDGATELLVDPRGLCDCSTDTGLDTQQPLSVGSTYSQVLAQMMVTAGVTAPLPGSRSQPHDLGPEIASLERDAFKDVAASRGRHAEPSLDGRTTSADDHGSQQASRQSSSGRESQLWSVGATARALGGHAQPHHILGLDSSSLLGETTTPVASNDSEVFVRMMAGIGVAARAPRSNAQPDNLNDHDDLAASLERDYLKDVPSSRGPALSPTEPSLAGETSADEFGSGRPSQASIGGESHLWLGEANAKEAAIPQPAQRTADGFDPYDWFGGLIAEELAARRSRSSSRIRGEARQRAQQGCEGRPSRGSLKSRSTTPEESHSRDVLRAEASRPVVAWLDDRGQGEAPEIPSQKPGPAARIVSSAGRVLPPAPPAPAVTAATAVAAAGTVILRPPLPPPPPADARLAHARRGEEPGKPREVPVIAQTSRAASASGVRGQYRQGRSTDDLSHAETKPAILGTRYPFERGQCVTAADGRAGIVRFIGETMCAPGMWVGIEFARPEGDCDGTFCGVRYFECESNCGAYLPVAAVQLKEPSMTRACSSLRSLGSEPDIIGAECASGTGGLGAEVPVVVDSATARAQLQRFSQKLRERRNSSVSRGTCGSTEAGGDGACEATATEDTTLLPDRSRCRRSSREERRNILLRGESENEDELGRRGQLDDYDQSTRQQQGRSVDAQRRPRSGEVSAKRTPVASKSKAATNGAAVQKSLNGEAAGGRRSSRSSLGSRRTSVSTQGSTIVLSECGTEEEGGGGQIKKGGRRRSSVSSKSSSIGKKDQERSEGERARRRSKDGGGWVEHDNENVKDSGSMEKCRQPEKPDKIRKEKKL